jgi:hypothetical protein
MGGLLKLDISSCFLYAEGTRLLAEALTGNQAMTELNISSNLMTTIPSVRDGEMSGAVAIADAIKNMGALSTVTMYKFPLSIQDIKTKIELDFSGKKLCPLDAIVIAALLPLNVSGTQFGYPIIADITFCSQGGVDKIRYQLE